MDAKTFLIQQHKTGRYEYIRSSHDLGDIDYGSRFWSAIVRLMENYAKVALNIPARKNQCAICCKDITELENNLFCEEHEKPIEQKNQICPHCGEDELGYDSLNGKLRCLCCKKFIKN